MIAVVKSPEASNTLMGQVTATEVCRTLRDDRIEGRTVVNEKDACICVRIIQVLHHKMQGQCNSIIGASVLPVRELQ